MSFVSAALRSPLKYNNESLCYLNAFFQPSNYVFGSPFFQFSIVSQGRIGNESCDFISYFHFFVFQLLHFSPLDLRVSPTVLLEDKEGIIPKLSLANDCLQRTLIF